MGLLKGIPTCISPDLLHALACMGHGDEIALVNAHFPGSTMARTYMGPKIIRADGVSCPILLKAILNLVNLDYCIPHPVSLMEVLQPRGIPRSDMWNTFKTVINWNSDNVGSRHIEFQYFDRGTFYERVRAAAVIVQTGESDVHGNIILTNGVVLPTTDATGYLELELGRILGPTEDEVEEEESD